MLLLFPAGSRLHRGLYKEASPRAGAGESPAPEAASEKPPSRKDSCILGAGCMRRPTGLLGSRMFQILKAGEHVPLRATFIEAGMWLQARQ